MISRIFRRIFKILGLTKENNAYRLIYVGHFLRMPILAAYAWNLLIREFSEVPQNRDSKKRILIISKSGGVDDVIESLSGSTINAKVDLISRSVFKTSANYYLNDEVGDQTYMTDDPEIERNKLKYRRFIKRVLRHFSNLYGCDVVMQFNYFYFAEREVATACSELGIRFVTGQKECLNSKPIEEYKTERLKEKFDKYEGYRISVYNQTQKNVIINAGFASESRVQITGCPRLNASHRKREIIPESGEKITILYYLIHDVAGLPVYKIDEQGSTYRGIEKNDRVSTWKPMVEQVNETLLKVARSNPDVRVILKTKTGVTKSQLKKFNIDALPHNIDIIKGGVGHDLLDQAHIVVGFNSTAVLEAMAAGRQTIVPFFKDLLNPEIYPYAIDFENGITRAESAVEFERSLENAIKDPVIMRDLGPNQIRVLDKYLGNGDGLADQRYRQFLEEALETDPQSVISQIGT